MKWKERWKKGLRVGAVTMVLLFLVGVFAFGGRYIPQKPASEDYTAEELANMTSDELKHIVPTKFEKR
jgi:hypothetical protein